MLIEIYERFDAHTSNSNHVTEIEMEIIVYSNTHTHTHTHDTSQLVNRPPRLRFKDITIRNK